MSNAVKSYEPGPDQAIERAAAGERVVVSRAGAELVAVVPLEDLRRLEELEAEEDALDVEAVKRFDADVAAGRAELVPFEQALAELGLNRDDVPR